MDTRSAQRPARRLPRLRRPAPPAGVPPRRAGLGPECQYQIYRYTYSSQLCSCFAWRAAELGLQGIHPAHAWRGSWLRVFLFASRTEFLRALMTSASLYLLSYRYGRERVTPFQRIMTGGGRSKPNPWCSSSGFSTLLPYDVRNCACGVARPGEEATHEASTRTVDSE
jgi:hypothetical protein